jgi:anti-sigma regulatory factor (Ser/Thr protein kinase)
VSAAPSAINTQAGCPLPPEEATSFEFDRTGLAEVRRRVEKIAEAAGLGQRATADLVLAASELAANSVAHGGGAGILRVWREDDRLVLDFEDAGWISEPLAGRLRPAVTQKGGRGLWLANQLCDLVQIRSSAAGTTVRLQVALD